MRVFNPQAHIAFVTSITNRLRRDVIKVRREVHNQGEVIITLHKAVTEMVAVTRELLFKVTLLEKELEMGKPTMKDVIEGRVPDPDAAEDTPQEDVAQDPISQVLRGAMRRAGLDPSEAAGGKLKEELAKSGWRLVPNA